MNYHYNIQVFYSISIISLATALLRNQLATDIDGPLYNKKCQTCHINGPLYSKKCQSCHYTIVSGHMEINVHLWEECVGIQIEQHFINKNVIQHSYMVAQNYYCSSSIISIFCRSMDEQSPNIVSCQCWSSGLE
jgi:hypothetical protein